MRSTIRAGGFGNLAFDVVIREGKAGHVWDVSGNEYVDQFVHGRADGPITKELAA